MNNQITLMCHMDSGERREECGITTSIVLYEYMINVETSWPLTKDHLSHMI